MKRGRFHASSTFSVVLAILSLSACTNHYGTAAPGKRSGVTTVSPSSGIGGSALTISAVVVNNKDSNLFDIVGTGGEMGAMCVKQGSGEEGEEEATDQTDPFNPNTCACHFAYLKPDGSREEFDESLRYVESNLIRCSYANVPRTTAAVEVTIHLVNSQSMSNMIRFPFSGTGRFLDLTDARSYLQPFRYQCRDSVFMGFPFGIALGATEVYDPILSEDPSISFAWNFYAGNMYTAAAAYIANNPADQNGNGSICPATPNDPMFGTDLSLFSLAPDSSGSSRIFPPIGSAFDRSTFYLARQASGVFNIPVNAYVAPFSISKEPAGGGLSKNAAEPSPIGYAVAPTPLQNGTETCPDTSVQIPPGFRWVKLWQFRASLNPRSAPRSVRLGNTGISCNPGTYNEPQPSATTSPTTVNTACEGGLVANSDDSILANRIIYGRSPSSQQTAASACVQLSHPAPNVQATACNDPTTGPGSGAGCTADFTGAQKSTYWAWPLASDIWMVQPNATSGGMSNLCANGAPADTLHLCQTPPNALVPFDDDVTYKVLESASRYDFLLVATPPTIHLKDMNDASNSSVLPYIPYRYYPGKCVSGDPGAPAFAGDCAVSNRINYSLKAHDVNDNGDEAPGTNNGRLPVFPVCALQPI